MPTSYSKATRPEKVGRVIQARVVSIETHGPKRQQNEQRNNHMSDRIIMRTGESLVAGGPPFTAAEPEVVCIKLVLYVRFEQVLTSVRKEQKRGAAPGP